MKPKKYTRIITGKSNILNKIGKFWNTDKERKQKEDENNRRISHEQGRNNKLYREGIKEE